MQQHLSHAALVVSTLVLETRFPTLLYYCLVHTNCPAETAAHRGCPSSALEAGLSAGSRLYRECLTRVSSPCLLLTFCRLLRVWVAGHAGLHGLHARPVGRRGGGAA